MPEPSTSRSPAYARAACARADPYRLNGRVTEVIGLVVEVDGPGGRGRRGLPDRRPAARRAPCAPRSSASATGRTLLMPLGEMHGIRPGAEVVATGTRRRSPVGAGAARPRARRPRPCRSTAASRSAGGRRRDVAGRRAARRRRCCARRIDATACPSACARSTRSIPCGARPAPRHLRRLRRRQVDAARHDRPQHRGRGQRHRPDRRARPRGARVHRARPRPGGPGALAWSWSRPPTSRRWCASSAAFAGHAHRRVLPRPRHAT